MGRHLGRHITPGQPAGRLAHLPQVDNHLAESKAQHIFIRLGRHFDGHIPLGQAISRRRHLLLVGNHLVEGRRHQANLTPVVDLKGLADIPYGQVTRCLGHD